jgi:gliding motility-associated-like protein
MFKINFLLVFNFFTSLIFSQQLIINEVSQGTGNKEYVEMVVVGNPICEGVPIPTIDLRRVIIDDNSGYFAAGSNVGIASGALRFSNDPFWQFIPQGTFIVIYTNGDKNPSIPADDNSITDGNCTIILPGNSPLLESNSISPNSSGNQTYPIADIDWVPSTGWGAMILANPGDSFQIPDLSNNGVPLHSVSWGNNDQQGNQTIYFTGSASGMVMSFKNIISNDPDIQANWVSEDVATNETPGAPNSLENDLWIGTMNPTCRVNPALNFAITNVDCGASNGSVTLTVANAANVAILWDNGNTTNTISNLQPGNYAVTVTDNLTLCTFTDIAVVTLNNSTLAMAPIVIEETCSNLCDGTVQLNISGGQLPYIEIWSQNNAPITTPTNFCAGIYDVEVRDFNNCALSQTITINATSALNYTVSNDTTICVGDSAILFVNGTANLVWSTTEITDSIKTSPAISTIFTVNISQNGCIANESIAVYVDYCNFALELTNIFTPNGDSLNDYFVPIKFEGVINSDFTIVNRWGVIMYESTNQIIKWDGKSQDGKEAYDGVYFYKMNYTEPIAGAKEIHGFLHLERK